MFQLFQTPLDLAHAYWKKLLVPGDLVIDATCGNGHDTLFLAKLNCSVIALDKQAQALQNTKELLSEHLDAAQLKQVQLFPQCHSSFPSKLSLGSISLLVYNLGYLPGGDKKITTESSTTLKSLQVGMTLIKPGGAISITCYPGHEAGKAEEEMLLHFTSSLDPKQWSCCLHRWINRRSAPSLLLLQKTYI